METFLGDAGTEKKTPLPKMSQIYSSIGESSGGQGAQRGQSVWQCFKHNRHQLKEKVALPIKEERLLIPTTL